LGGEKWQTDCSKFQSQGVSNGIYDPKIRSCATGLGKTCYNFTAACKNKDLAAYPGDPNIFALCVADKVFQMYTCPKGSVFDEANSKCSVPCTKEGRIADPDDSTKFIMCISTALNRYTQVPDKCPTGAIFDATTSDCVLDPNHTTPAPVEG
jgi:hypothetical protein